MAHARWKVELREVVPPEFLRWLYEVRGLSTREIGLRLDCTAPSIQELMRKYDIPPRAMATVEERFWPKVRKLANGCWEWTGSKDGKGYGSIQMGKRTAAGNRRPDRAHRVSYELFVGPIPSGLQLDHLCRNRGCVNPAHLEPVTCQENVLRGFRSRAIERQAA